MPDTRAERSARAVAERAAQHAVDAAAAGVAARDGDDEDVSPLVAFVKANPDPASWTNAQLRTALVRLIRMELRRRHQDIA